MWRMILSIVIAFSFLISDTVSARRSKSPEAQKLAEFSDKVSRQGNELFLTLKDGTVLSRKDSRPSAGYHDCDGNVATTYTFLDFIDPWYLIHEQYYEGSGTEFINCETGETVRVDGYVELCHDKSRFIAFGYPGEAPCNVEIWKISRSGLSQEWQGSCDNSLKWLNTDAIEVAAGGDVKYLKYDGTSWKFSSSSPVAKKDERIGESQARQEEDETHEEWAIERAKMWDLMNAATAGDLEEVQRLVRNGSDVNAKDAEGATALWKASRLGYVDIVKFLLANGADVNAENMYGWTVLNCTAWEGHLEVVRVLLDYGADVTVKNDYCQTALESAEEKRHHEIAELLKSHTENK
jgi:hypothetical protein